MATKTAPTKTDETTYDRIQVAIRFTKKWHKQVDHNNRLWNGTLRPKNVAEEDKANPNYTFAVIKSKLARLYYRNPRIDVVPTNGKDVSVPDIRANAKNAELVVNKQMKDPEYSIRRHIKLALLDWKRTGIGAVFTGWETKFHPTEKVELPQTNPDGTPVLDELGQPVLEKMPRLVKDGPDIRRVHPKHVHLPPGFTEEHQDYVVIEFQRPYKEVMKDKRYDKEALKDLEGMAREYIDKEYLEGEGKEKDKTKATEDLARITEYHYYDQDSWCVYAKGVKKPLLEDKNPYAEIFGEDDPLPITLIFGDDDLESPWPISEVQTFEDQQLELDRIRAQQINHRKRFNRKALYDKGAITNDEIEKLKNPEDGTMVGVLLEGPQTLETVYRNLEEADLRYPEGVEQHIKEDIQVISGISSTGLAGISTNDTLGQDQIAESRSKSREDEEQAMVEEYVERIYRRLLQLDQAKLQEAVAVKVSADPANQEWLNVSPEDIQGSMFLNVVSGSMVRETDEVVRKQASDVMNILAPLPQFAALLPDVAISILDTYPMFSTVAEKAKAILEQAQMMPAVPMAPPAPGQLQEAPPTPEGISAGANQV